MHSALCYEHGKASTSTKGMCTPTLYISMGGTYNDVCHETEDQEGQVCRPTPASIDDFQDGMCCGGLALDFDGQQAKQNNLDGCTGCIPVPADPKVLSSMEGLCTLVGLQIQGGSTCVR